MQYVWDEHGRRYLDALGGIVTVSVGHCHPDVVEVVRKQNETLQHSTTIYLATEHRRLRQEAGGENAGRIESLLFHQLRFGSERSRAVDGAPYTNNYEVISLRNAYHGGSTLTMGMTGNRGWKFNVPHSFGVHHAITPDPLSRIVGTPMMPMPEKNTRRM